MAARFFPFAVAFLALLAGPVSAPALDLPTQKDDRLLPVFHANRVWNGVTTTVDGRVFVCYPGADGPGVGLEEIKPDGSHEPYPDAEWNGWQPKQSTLHAFVCVNAVRVGPDGNLWVVDAGCTGPGEMAIPGAGRVVQIDLRTNQLIQVFLLGTALKAKSYVDDIRFNGAQAYLTDAGEPGLIVLDLTDGSSRRLLDDDPSTTDRRPMYADGKVMYGKDGRERFSHADQLEVSPDGKYLYYQPCPGPMSRLETRWLNDPRLPASEVAKHVEAWWDAPTCGGTAIDAEGNLYFSDTNRQRILKITPEKEISTVVADPRLEWSDAMWIDAAGFLWLPATQQNLTPGFTGGKAAVNYPVWIYKLPIGAKPAPNDHS